MMESYQAMPYSGFSPTYYVHQAVEESCCKRISYFDLYMIAALSMLCVIVSFNDVK